MGKSKASSSKPAVPASGEVLGFDPSWCIPFISVLESNQSGWNDLVRKKDNDGKQVFLRTTRDALTTWAEDEGLSSQLPNNLKLAIGSYFNDHQCLPEATAKANPKANLVPKKIKTTYQIEDVIKKMYPEHVKTATQHLFETYPAMYSKKMNASRDAVRKVKSDLTKAERKPALDVLDQWNLGNIVSDAARCLLTETYLAKEIDSFIETVEKKHEAHIFMMIAYLFLIYRSSFETKPRNKKIKPFSSSDAWKECNGFETTGYEEYLLSLWGNDSTKKGKPLDTTDVGSNMVWFSPLDPNAGAAAPKVLPMLVVLADRWTLKRLRNGWRHWATETFKYHSGARNVTTPWSKLKQETSTMVEYGCDIDIDWDDPSRLVLKKIRENWRAVNVAQKHFFNTGRIPVTFTPASYPTSHKEGDEEDLFNMEEKSAKPRKRKGPYVDLSDEDADKHSSAKGDAHSSPRRSGRLSTKRPRESSRFKSKPTVDSDDDKSDEPPRKKKRADPSASREPSPSPTSKPTHKERTTSSLRKSARSGCSGGMGSREGRDGDGSDVLMEPPVPAKKKGKGKAKAAPSADSDVDLDLLEDVSRAAGKSDPVSSGEEESDEERSDEESSEKESSEEEEPGERKKSVKASTTAKPGPVFPPRTKPGPSFPPGTKPKMSRQPTTSNKDKMFGDDNDSTFGSPKQRRNIDPTLYIPETLPTKLSDTKQQCPAYALLHGHQKEYLESLSTRPEYERLLLIADYTQMDMGAYLKYLPEWLSWSHRELVLPAELHDMSTRDLQRLMNQIVLNVKERGVLTHCDVLALGLLLETMWLVMDLDTTSIHVPARHRTSPLTMDHIGIVQETCENIATMLRLSNAAPVAPKSGPAPPPSPIAKEAEENTTAPLASSGNVQSPRSLGVVSKATSAVEGADQSLVTEPIPQATEAKEAPQPSVEGPPIPTVTAPAPLAEGLREQHQGILQPSRHTSRKPDASAPPPSAGSSHSKSGGAPLPLGGSLLVAPDRHASREPDASAPAPAVGSSHDGPGGAPPAPAAQPPGPQSPRKHSVPLVVSMPEIPSAEHTPGHSEPRASPLEGGEPSAANDGYPTENTYQDGTLVFVRKLPAPSGEIGSPAHVRGGSGPSTFIAGLSDIPNFTKAAGLTTTKARQTIDTILNEGKRFPKKDIQPVILLAFGLMLHDITAVNLVKAGGSPDPPYVDQMALEEDDMLAINDALADYLEWSGNSGAVTDKRQSKRTAKAERSGSN
ncbi:hypothetical protein HWV62_26771 [Athelia sp. TMB]|nr:hypothetical protein HWV62_26771 [Athelia sp. TMB]